MMQFGSCPRCHMDIAEERRRSQLVVCDSCGFVLSTADAELRDAIDKKFSYVAIAIAILIVAGFMQVTSWDKHALTVIPLQIKSLLGGNSLSDMEKMAEICMDRRKFDCVEKQYSKIAEQDMQQLLRLGKFQMSRARYQEAAHTYRTFFSRNGIDLEGSYLYARALGQIGQVDEASKYYDYVLGAKPGVVQVTVVQNYVKLLMEAQRLDQAKQLIQGVRKTSDASSYFMEDELKKIQDLQGSRT